MALTATLIALCWIVFLLTWAVTAVVYRPTASDARPARQTIGRRRWLRLLVAILVIIAIRTGHAGTDSFGHAVGLVGVAVCAAGIGTAIWARLCLGRNWGMPMTVRAQPALVSRGPYHVVRHPIYSGLMLAMLGTALATGIAALAALAGMTVYFVLSLQVEEADMAALFPDQYPEYARHTKRLIPFVY